MIIAKLLLDTSFLLPIFRIVPDIQGYNNDFTIILNDTTNQYYYSSVSLIEIKWKFIKLERTQNKHLLQSAFERYQIILLRDKRFQMIHPYNTDINRISDTLRNNGHRDYFDTLIAATALWSCDGIVTEDNDLRSSIDLISQEQYNKKKFQIYHWKEYRDSLKNFS